MYYLGSRALARCIHPILHIHTYIHPYIHPYINKTRSYHISRSLLHPYTIHLHTIHPILHPPPPPPCLSLPLPDQDTYSPSAPNAAKEVPYILLLLAHPRAPCGPAVALPARRPFTVHRLPITDYCTVFIPRLAVRVCVLLLARLLVIAC